MKSFLSDGESCVLTIFTPVPRPSLSDDGIDSCLRLAPFLYVPGLVSADLYLQIFKVSMNRLMGVVRDFLCNG